MAMLVDVERLGGKIYRSLYHTRDVFHLIYDTAMNLSALKEPLVRSMLYRQIYFTGIQAISVIAVIGTLIGIVIITQITNIVGVNPLLIGKILVWTVIRELGPLLAAIIIIARSSTAIASELGSMKANKEVDMLIAMGISPLRYLIVPRILGTALCVVILTFYFQVFAVAGGLFLSSAFISSPFLPQLKGIFSILGFSEIIASLIKSILFGMIIATTSCYHGLRVRESITEVPQVTSFAVMQSLSLVFIFDGIVTVIFFV